MEEKSEGLAPTQTGQAKEVKVPLTSDRGKLKVPPIEAHRGDRIVWETDNRNVSIWFPTSGVFPVPALAHKKRGNVVATVPWEATPGKYQYVIYCHDTDEFAECNSHPIMVIPGP